MRNNLKIIATVVGMMTLHANLFAQATEWETEKTDDDRITVKNRVSKRIDINGDEQQLVEYIATTTTGVTMKKLVAVMRDVVKHKDFMGQHTSAKVKTLSENECVVYYFYKGVWPYPSSDIVAKMVFSEDVAENTVTFTFTAAPSLVDDKGVRRLDYYNLIYLFKALDNGDTVIAITSKFTPAVQLPAFMIGMWFPDGPADYLLDIIKLAGAG